MLRAKLFFLTPARSGWWWEWGKPAAAHEARCASRRPALWLISQMCSAINITGIIKISYATICVLDELSI